MGTSSETIQMKAPTADELDHTTPEERYRLIGQCSQCGEWTAYDKRTDDPVCYNDSNRLEMRSIHSERTFNPKQSTRRAQGA